MKAMHMLYDSNGFAMGNLATQDQYKQDYWLGYLWHGSGFEVGIALCV
jgi:hypothetical protein